MNFFEAQSRTRRNSRYLLLLFCAATLAVVAAVTALISFAVMTTGGTWSAVNIPLWAAENVGFLALTATGVLTFIVLASLIRIAGLRDGGGRVARDLGATPLNPGGDDLQGMVLRNVVEEMALASGTPVPETFVLEQEPGINAFAAGFRPEDAAIAVTRGAVDKLNRSELQGVIAHEFSHILNGDMRLNIQLMGPLYGISAVGLLGRSMLRGAGRARRGKGSAAGGVLILGLGLIITGYAGLFFARLIKAAVSRQREFLADASAVQFTREVEGLLGAFQKIGQRAGTSRFKATEGEEISHMLFASGGRKTLSSLLATHPPLRKRIAALDPEGQYAVAIPDALEAEAMATTGNTVGFAGTAVSSAAVLDSIGNPDSDNIERARQMHGSLSPELLDAARSPESVPLLLLGLALHQDSATRSQQLELLYAKLGNMRGEKVALLAGLVDEHVSRLALVEIAFPAFKRRPAENIEFTLDLLDELISIDQHIDLYEFALTRLLRFYLQRASYPARSTGSKSLSNRFARDAAQQTFAILAIQGLQLHTDDSVVEAARPALREGLAALKCPPDSADTENALLQAADSARWPKVLDKALQRLQLLEPASRETLIGALLATALHDGRVNRREFALLQTVCAILDCPLPPAAIPE